MKAVAMVADFNSLVWGENLRIIHGFRANQLPNLYSSGEPKEISTLFYRITSANCKAEVEDVERESHGELRWERVTYRRI